MGTHARIEFDSIRIDTSAWLAQRTAGPVTELTGDLHSWGTRTLARDATLRGWQDLVPLWRLARGYVSPHPADPGDPGILAHRGTRLDADLWIARMHTPSHGLVAVVIRDDDLPVVFTDTGETADWYDAGTVQILCPGGHGWWWRTGRELLTADLAFTTLTVVFGANLDAPFSRCRVCEAYDTGRRSAPCGCDGTPWIVCPLCSQRCDVHLPGATPSSPHEDAGHRRAEPGHGGPGTADPTPDPSGRVSPLPDDPGDVWQRAMRSLDDEQLRAARQANAARAQRETGAGHAYYLARLAWLDQLIQDRTTA